MTALSGRLATFKRYVPLLQELVFRDIKVKYRGSLLGVVWSLLSPLLNMLVMMVVFSTIFSSDIENFPVYYLSGFLVFGFNQEATSESMYSIIHNSALLRKVYVPKYVFPISKVCTAMVNSLFLAVVMLIIMLITGAKFYWTLLLLPLALLYTAIFSTGLGLFLAAVAARFRDMCYFYTVILTAWSYLTPIFYPVSMLPEIAQFLENFNPMFHYVNFSRNIILYGTAPSGVLHLFCLGCGVIMLAIGVYAFYKLQDTFLYYV